MTLLSCATTWLDEVWTPRRVLFCFMALNFFTYFDRGIISACIPAIKIDRVIAPDGPLPDAKSGALVSTFMVSFMIMSPLFVYSQARVAPIRIITFGVLMWIISLISTMLSFNYIALICSRALTGFGEAAFASFASAIIDDIAPKASRTLWLGGYYAMLPVGQAGGVAFGGAISQKMILGLKGWRVAFGITAVVSAPVWFALCVIPTKALRSASAPASIPPLQENLVDNSNICNMHMVLDEEAATPSETYTVLESLKVLGTNWAYLMIVLGYSFYTFSLGALAVWTVNYVSQGPLHMSVSVSSLSFGISTLVTGILGSLIGGKLMDIVGSTGLEGAKRCTLFNASTTFFGIVFAAASFCMTNKYAFFALFIPAELFIFNVTAPINAAIISVVPHQLRSHAMSFTVLLIHTLGDFPSPIIAGVLNDAFSYGCNHQTTMESCAHHSANCIWRSQVDIKAQCLNKDQLRNSMLCVISVSCLAILAWILAWFLIDREQRKQEALVS